MKTINRSQLIELYKSLKETKPSRPVVIWGLVGTGKLSIIKEIYAGRMCEGIQNPMEGHNYALKNGKVVRRADDPDYFDQYSLPFDPSEEYVDICLWMAGRSLPLTDEDYRYFHFLAKEVCPYKPLVWIIDSTINPKLAPDLETYADIYDYQLTCEDWIEYAKSINVSPIIIDFLQKHKEFFNVEETDFGSEEKCKRCLGSEWEEIDREFKEIIANDNKNLCGALYGDLYIELKSQGTTEENLPLFCLLALIHPLRGHQVQAGNEIIREFAKMYNLTDYLPKIKVI